MLAKLVVGRREAPPEVGYRLIKLRVERLAHVDEGVVGGGVNLRDVLDDLTYLIGLPNAGAPDARIAPRHHLGRVGPPRGPLWPLRDEEPAGLGAITPDSPDDEREPPKLEEPAGDGKGDGEGA